MVTVTVKGIIETLDYILENKSSVARFGEGEIDIMAGRGIPFQDYDEELATRMREILSLQTSPEFLVCLIDAFERTERYNAGARQYWESHVERYKDFYNDFPLADWYGSSFISRLYIDWEDKSPAKTYFEKIKQIWQDRDILIVEGETSRSGMGNDLFANAKSISRIICPSHNAYSRFEDIKAAAKRHGKDKLVLAMLGPTAKVLAKDLSDEGYQIIDLGHIDSEYEWFQMGAISKVKLSNKKHTAEHNFDQDVDVMGDKEYMNQIVENLVEPSLSKEQPLISLIVPVYNVENYLTVCVDSILSQTYKKLDIILVNDGSTDNSGRMCNDYAQKDSRIRVVHQANAGLSAARNTGLKYAQGSHVTFVDSDDFVGEDYVQNLVTNMLTEDADVVIGEHHYYYDDRHSYGFITHPLIENGVKELSFSEILKEIDEMTFNVSVRSAWGSLVKKDLFQYVDFPEGRLYEDTCTMLALYQLAQKVILIDKGDYFYRVRWGSITNSHRELKHFEDRFYVFKEKLIIFALTGQGDDDYLDYLKRNLEKQKQDFEEACFTYTDSYKELCKYLTLVKSRIAQ